MPKNIDDTGGKSASRADSVRRKRGGEAHYALNGLPNTIRASEYKVQLPDEKLLADELIRSQTMLGTQLTDAG